MKTIENRTDIDLLVHRFYAKIRKDDLLGDIFNSHIGDDWPTHLAKLGDFWETNLLGIPKFKGSPTQAHIKVDKNLNYSITQLHFGKWIELWYQTIDELFDGELANRAKTAARNMSTGQFVAIWSSRPKSN